MTDRNRTLSSNGLPNRSLLLTVAVEDYFQGKAFAGVIDERQWPRFEARVERNTLAALDLLDRNRARGTFFFMTWIASRHPGLIREVVRRGHEVASSGGSQRSFRKLPRGEFADEVAKSRDALESAAGVKVHGFRAADHRLSPADLWALRTLAEHGYSYDSSINPSLISFRSQPWRRFIHEETFETGRFCEVPLSSLEILGVHIPVAGGNWFRQLPESVIRSAVRGWTETCAAPFVMYFRVWDLDTEQPVITGAPALSRLRHYRNPERVPRLIESFLSEYSSCTIAEYLGLVQTPVAASTRRSDPVELGGRPSRAGFRRTPVTVVIPCYNEQATLPYLANTLTGLRIVAERYELRFVFVNDGSRDGTFEELGRLFGAEENCNVLRHDRNQGVAAAILTGIRAATTETVCSMDCDCTYDPHELVNMIPLLADGIDLVTASPYHPAGRVERVPGWRLALSRTASLLYRMVLRHRLYTYTSCFRVYRRSAILPLQVEQRGFLGVAELLGKLDLNGGRIVEHPATLHVRMLGHSKMKVLGTIIGHLGLLSRFALDRLLHRTKANSRVSREFGPPALAPKGIERD